VTTAVALRFGDVIVVPFPFTDQSATKMRPAVVVSSDAYQRERPDLIPVVAGFEVIIGGRF